MHGPDVVLRPHVPFRHSQAQAVHGHHVRRPHLAVELDGRVGEIVLLRLVAIRPVSGHHVSSVPRSVIVRRAGNIVQTRVQFLGESLQRAVERLWRQALVAAAIEAHGGMVADLQNVIPRVAQEQIVIVGVGAVGRICQPEVLPHHDAVLVARVVESLVAGETHPVPNHGEVLVALVAHGNVVLAGAVAQHGFRKAPVSAAGDKTPAIDPHFKRISLFAVRELAHAGLELFDVGDGFIRGGESQLHGV